jgi:hypothetical protein
MTVVKIRDLIVNIPLKNRLIGPAPVLFKRKTPVTSRQFSDAQNNA